MPVLQQCLGRWRLTRDISDGARFDGFAVIAPSGDGAAYAEDGKLTLPGHAPIRATRNYIWRAADGVIAVHFTDGRFFHSFDPAIRAPQARHHCGSDIYDVVYDFSDWPVWSATWRVEGPRKSYRMRSVCRADTLTATGQAAMAAP